MKTLSAFFCLTLLVASAPSLFAAPDRGLVTTVSGSVTYAAPNSLKFAPLTRGAVVEVGGTIRTGADGKVVIAAIPGSALRLGPNAELKLSTLQPATNGRQGKVTVELKSGSMSALIDAKQERKPDFQIKTPKGTAAARGTFYGVSVKDGEVYTAVREGEIGVKMR